MEKECMNCGGSIYFQCRKEAAKYNDRLSSREGASEMLNVSVSSLSNYELGLTPVPTDVVVRMADLFPVVLFLEYKAFCEPGESFYEDEEEEYDA